jgi:hypothetical protein
MNNKRLFLQTTNHCPNSEQLAGDAAQMSMLHYFTSDRRVTSHNSTCGHSTRSTAKTKVLRALLEQRQSFWLESQHLTPVHILHAEKSRIVTWLIMEKVIRPKYSTPGGFSVGTYLTSYNPKKHRRFVPFSIIALHEQLDRFGIVMHS